jgi:mRNA-degrading endonuclease RelE of RelBE toxin-antitoxin system
VARVAFRQELVEAREHDLVLRNLLRRACRRLQESPEVGKPLGRELAGCRSIRIGGSESRLVYRYHRAIDLVEVIAIERRRGGEAYDVATARVRVD